MKTKARIYQNPVDGHGIVLSGEVVSFFLGTEGWDVVMKGSRVAEEHPELFDIINDQTQGKMLKGEFEGEKPKSKAEIGKDDTVWLGFQIAELEFRFLMKGRTKTFSLFFFCSPTPFYVKFMILLCISFRDSLR